MAHRITLIITEELININTEIPHFFENGFLIIPFNNNGSEISRIEELSKSHKTFDEIFNTFLIDYWEDEILGESIEIQDYKSLLLVELIMRLKLKDFLIYHYEEVNFEIYSHSVNFENKIVTGNGFTKFDKTNIDINNYRRYDSCEKNYFNKK